MNVQTSWGVCLVQMDSVRYAMGSSSPVTLMVLVPMTTSVLVFMAKPFRWRQADPQRDGVTNSGFTVSLLPQVLRWPRCWLFISANCPTFRCQPGCPASLLSFAFIQQSVGQRFLLWGESLRGLWERTVEPMMTYGCINKLPRNLVA